MRKRRGTSGTEREPSSKRAGTTGSTGNGIGKGAGNGIAVTPTGTRSRPGGGTGSTRTTPPSWREREPTTGSTTGESQGNVAPSDDGSESWRQSEESERVGDELRRELSKRIQEYGIRKGRRRDRQSASRVAILASEVFLRVAEPYVLRRPEKLKRILPMADMVESVVFDYALENNLRCDPLPCERDRRGYIVQGALTLGRRRGHPAVDPSGICDTILHVLSSVT